ncbi:hypothetical protein HJG60_011421 [Phyllostomus discolor]|uniref:Uncharacterized protein n=1 Tax=Phyllostomus discolor TaxID=89673 RepID=A0A834E7V2_9CHIR|nr:hypothetical protein HJG60_011421 [Phyllostomus discolor]
MITQPKCLRAGIRAQAVSAARQRCPSSSSSRVGLRGSRKAPLHPRLLGFGPASLPLTAPRDHGQQGRRPIWVRIPNIPQKARPPPGPTVMSFCGTRPQHRGDGGDQWGRRRLEPVKADTGQASQRRRKLEPGSAGRQAEPAEGGGASGPGNCSGARVLRVSGSTCVACVWEQRLGVSGLSPKVLVLRAAGSHRGVQGRSESGGGRQGGAVLPLLDFWFIQQGPNPAAPTSSCPFLPSPAGPLLHPQGASGVG